ncbi:DUF4133 domain-containing protein [Rhodocytophaga rosea]|uniref:DUF4133 domain-containing protein n=1 Tax=Rhodocytophaga rosea TaxID=2704465 RepID=A0A6C0GC19_9BACT|nr:DUF4133 domain-containing protein [Rhodocytophaga rosea]QHT65394.1 DUF4133 domain-containing protein [Rhodocytophaga rosea]
MPQYEVIRGADNEIEFQGLKGKYVYYLFGGLAGVVLMGLLFFLLLPSSTLAGLLTLSGAAGVFYLSFQWNKKYGRWGMEKQKIQKQLPGYVVMRHPYTLIKRKNA